MFDEIRVYFILVRQTRTLKHNLLSMYTLKYYCNRAITDRL